MLNKGHKDNNSGAQKIKFLSDLPLAADREQDVRFGHLGIANNLRDIILQSPLPFTIGLFGRWGSGKTTIINVLKKKLEENKVAVLKFDVWKHERDSLRRALLEEMVKQSRKSKYLKKGFSLNARLKTPIQKTISGKFECNFKGWSFLSGILVLILGAGAYLYCNHPKAFGIYSSIVSGGSLFSALFLWVLQRTVTSETLTTTLEAFKDPHEFEEEFERIVKEISATRLLIIIDNLDRCTHSRAVELLSTIKTFLAKDTEVSEDNKCIFLIACDDEAIERHLESVYLKINDDSNTDKSSFSADEFLRKFFNTFVRIPDFIDTELQTYTKDLLEETSVSQFDSSDVAYVITNAFRENPRQIKQFINILLAHFLLAQERESGKKPLIIPKGTITNNVAFLAKFLVIRQKFPSEYRKIRESYLTLKEMEGIGINEYKDFLKATKLILAEDIRPFIYLKQSKEELEIPGIRELELALVDDNRDIVKDKLKTIKENSEQMSSLRSFITALITRNAMRRSPLLNIILCSLEAFRHHNLELEQVFYNKVADLLNDNSAFKAELRIIDPSLIIEEILTRCHVSDRDRIVAEYTNILIEQKADKKEPTVSLNYAYNLIKELLKHKDWLKKKDKVNVKQCLTEEYYSSVKILSLFAGKVEDQKDFVSDALITKFVGSFSEDDIKSKEDINEKVKLLLKFKEIITPQVAGNIISNLQTLLNNENQNPYRTEKENFLESIEQIFSFLKLQITKITDKASLNTFADTIVQGMNAAGGDWNQRKIFIFTCLEIVDILEEPQKSNINAPVQEFYTNAETDSIMFIFDKPNLNSKEGLILRYASVFQQRAMQQQPIFDLFYPLAPKDIRIQWIAELITSHPQRALDKLKDLKYKVDDKIKVVDALLQSAEQVAVQEKGGLYDAANEMGCANAAEQRTKLVSQIKSLLNITDNNQQEVGYSALQGAAKHISETARREIARETVEWLRTLEPTTSGQSYSIKSVLLAWSILESPVQDDYIDFIFDKLIKRGVDAANISLGFEILLQINPGYEDYSAYFDDVFNRVESESDDQIKVELKSSLLKLKPSQTNTKNKAFWNKLAKLSDREVNEREKPEVESSEEEDA